LNLTLGVLGAIRVTVKVILRNVVEQLLLVLVLHVDRVVVKALDRILTIVEQFLVLAEAFKMINRHQDLRQLSNLLELG